MSRGFSKKDLDCLANDVHFLQVVFRNRDLGSALSQLPPNYLDYCRSEWTASLLVAAELIRRVAEEAEAVIDLVKSLPLETLDPFVPPPTDR